LDTQEEINVWVVNDHDHVNRALFFRRSVLGNDILENIQFYSLNNFNYIISFGAANQVGEIHFIEAGTVKNVGELSTRIEQVLHDGKLSNLYVIVSEEWLKDRQATASDIEKIQGEFSLDAIVSIDPYFLMEIFQKKP
jgi:hypothetical protein